MTYNHHSSSWHLVRTVRMHATLRCLHEFRQSKWHQPSGDEWQLPFSFYCCSILCLDCSKDCIIRKHKKVPSYIRLSNWAVTWSSQNRISILPKRLFFFFLNSYTETGNWTRHTLIIRSDAMWPSFPGQDCPWQAPGYRSQHTQVCCGAAAHTQRGWRQTSTMKMVKMSKSRSK